MEFLVSELFESMTRCPNMMATQKEISSYIINRNLHKWLTLFEIRLKNYALQLASGLF